MSKLVFNRDGGKTDEFGHLIGLMRFMQGEVIEGLQVAANGAPNMSVNVPYGIAAIPVGSGATGYRYFVGLDATENVTIPTANGSNPRNDLIVLWVDKAVTPSQSFTNNSNNILKISVVSGAPAATPADPSVAAIQAAIGAANPYIILARVLTGTGVTQINSGNITDLRSLTSVNRILSDMVATAAIQNLAVTTGKLADSAVTAIKIAAGVISGDKLAANAIYLGHSEVKSTVSPTTSGLVVTTTTVTVPTTSRKIRVKFTAPQLLTSVPASDRYTVLIKEDGVLMEQWYFGVHAVGLPLHFEAIKDAPAAGSHTYTTTFIKDQGTGGGTMYASIASGANSRIKQVVELV